MKVRDIVKTIFFTEILKGLALTLKTMFTPAVTRQYPEEKRPAMPGFRGMHAFVRDPETGRERCIACGLCGAICPSQCIHIYTTESPEGKKVIDRYEIDLLRCVFCAFCVEACPVGAISLSEHFEYSGSTREEFYMTKEKLLDNWDRLMAGPKGEAYFKKYWHPVSDDFRAYEGQAVFRGLQPEGGERENG
ncbi:MAG: NADH-quinone oxidoreductase subunit NuoI [Thermodesulfovibrionales bacterium]